MGWGFRRSVNLGPLRLNLSKSGLGYSVGTRGFRVGKDAKGRKYRSLSIPQTGIFRRDYYSSSKAPASSQALPPNSPAAQVMPASAQKLGAGMRWAIYVGGGVLLYALIRTIF
jgi:hypothetical protein